MSDQGAAEFSKIWKNEASEITGDDQMRTVITRSFDGLCSLNGSNHADLEYLVAAMQTEREVAFKFDKQVASDPFRLFFYGINEAIQKTIENSIAKEGVIVQTEGVVATLPILKVKVENAPDVIPTQESENESTNKPASDVQMDAITPNSPLTGNETSATDGVMAPLINNDSQATNGSASVPQTTGVGANSLPNRKESVDVASIDKKIPKTSASGSSRKEGGGGHGTATDVVMAPLINDSHTGRLGCASTWHPRLKDHVNTLNCPRCPEKNMNMTSFLTHLQKVHKNTPGNMNIVFECACGYVATNSGKMRVHTNSCDSVLVTVIDRSSGVRNVLQDTPAKARVIKNDGPILNTTATGNANVVESAPTLTLPETPIQPDTPNGMMAPLIDNGVAPSHAVDGANGGNETVPARRNSKMLAVERRDSGRSKTREDSLDCPRCTERDMTLADFVEHLSSVHNTTAAKANLAFLCSCGFVEPSAQAVRFHKYTCRSCVLSVIKRQN